MAFDIDSIRAKFPILRSSKNGKPLAYLDSGATSQRPQSVIDSVSRFYTEQNANIHRGAYLLSVEATALYDKARKKVADFVNAACPREIVFTRGTTEAINLVAATWGQQHVSEGDEILLTVMEHHANIVPWQVLADQRGATLKVVDIDDMGELDLEQFEDLLSERTKIAAFTHVSNVLGTTNPVAQMVATAKQQGAITLIDGAQAVAHGSVDVQEIGSDFYIFSGHKMFGPDGIGVLHGKVELLDAMPPYQTGGDMIELVSFEKTTFRASPERFEAGTPNISGALGLATAIEFLDSIDLASAHEHEMALLHSATAQLTEITGIEINGTSPSKQAVLSFTLKNAHPHDIATVLDANNVAIRAGHHCAQPLMRRLGVNATARASFSIYNTDDDVAALIASVKRVAKLFAE